MHIYTIIFKLKGIYIVLESITKILFGLKNVLTLKIIFPEF